MPLVLRKTVTFSKTTCIAGLTKNPRAGQGFAPHIKNLCGFTYA